MQENLSFRLRTRQYSNEEYRHVQSLSEMSRQNIKETLMSVSNDTEQDAMSPPVLLVINIILD